MAENRKSHLESKIRRLNEERKRLEEEIEKEKIWLKVQRDTESGILKKQECILEMLKYRSKFTGVNLNSKGGFEALQTLQQDLKSLQVSKIKELSSLMLIGNLAGVLSLPGEEAEIRGFSGFSLEASLCELMKFLRLAISYLSLEISFGFDIKGRGSKILTGDGEIPLFSQDIYSSALRVNYLAYIVLMTAAGEVAHAIGMEQEQERPFLFIFNLSRGLRNQE